MRCVLVLVLAVSAMVMSGQAKQGAATAPSVWGGVQSAAEGGVKPDVADVKYGPHERNVLDLYFPAKKSDKPMPVLVVIHGGGFLTGSKGGLKMTVLNDCRKAGIVVAAINYRYSSQAPAPGPF